MEARAVSKILWAHVEAGSYLPDWRPWQDYRKSYTARRELGGGILLDGSHEIDYMTWLFGAPRELACMADHVSELEVNVEDCATILMRFADGTVTMCIWILFSVLLLAIVHWWDRKAKCIGIC